MSRANNLNAQTKDEFVNPQARSQPYVLAAGEEFVPTINTNYHMKVDCAAVAAGTQITLPVSHKNSTEIFGFLTSLNLGTFTITSSDGAARFLVSSNIGAGASVGTSTLQASAVITSAGVGRSTFRISPTWDGANQHWSVVVSNQVNQETA